MGNIQIKVKDNKAVITIDLSKDFGPSKSGKTIVVATTRGDEMLYLLPCLTIILAKAGIQYFI